MIDASRQPGHDHDPNSVLTHLEALKEPRLPVNQIDAPINLIDTGQVEGANLEAYTPLSAMSAEQLTAFWVAVEADASLQETLKGAADLDAAVAVAKEAGFDVSKADLLEYQAQQTLELSDEDLAKVAGGFGGGFEGFGEWGCGGMDGMPCTMPRR